MLGKDIHRACHEDLEGPGKLLSLFESIAESYNEAQQYMHWLSPLTNFPVTQNYRQPTTYRTLLSYGEDRLNVVVENWEEATLDKESQKLGASPNIVHSLDAAHMTIVISSADYDVAAIHDSWGTTAGNMGDLFIRVRQQFVKLYEEDPLLVILRQLGAEALLPKRGKLNIESILTSDYSFC